MSQNLVPQREASGAGGRVKACTVLERNVHFEGCGEEHGHAELFARGEERHVLQGQATAAMRLAAGRVQQLALVAPHDAEQVDAANDNAGRGQKVRVMLTEDAVEEGAELNGGAGREREALGAGPYENRRLRDAVQQLVLVAHSLRLHLLEVAHGFAFTHAELAAEGERGLAHRSQQLVGVHRRLRSAVGSLKQRVRVVAADGR